MKDQIPLIFTEKNSTLKMHWIMIYRAKGTLCNQKKISRLGSLGSKPWAHFSKPRLDTCKAVYHPYPQSLNLELQIVSVLALVTANSVSCVSNTEAWNFLSYAFSFVLVPVFFVLDIFFTHLKITTWHSFKDHNNIFSQIYSLKYSENDLLKYL